MAKKICSPENAEKVIKEVSGLIYAKGFHLKSKESITIPRTETSQLCPGFMMIDFYSSTALYFLGQSGGYSKIQYKFLGPEEPQTDVVISADSNGGFTITNNKTGYYSQLNIYFYRLNRNIN